MRAKAPFPGISVLSALFSGPDRTMVFYFGGVFFVLGCSLAVGQGSVYALFLKRYGVDHLPLMYVFLGFIMTVAALCYFAVVNRYPTERILRAGLLLVSLLLLCSWIWTQTLGSDAVYPVLLFIYEVASEWLMLHAAFYLSQNLDTTQLKRIGPVLLGVWQTGIILGGFLLALLSPLLGLPNMILIWLALSFFVTIFVSQYHRVHGVSRYSRTTGKGRYTLGNTISEVRRGLTVMWNTALVRAVAVGMVFLVIAVYILIYLVNRVYTAHFEGETELSSFLGWLILCSGSLALLFQFFFTGRIIQSLGVAKAYTILPVALFGSFVALGISFTLPSAILGAVSKDVLLPGIHRPSRNVILNAIPASIQASMRALLLVVVIPLGLICGGVLLFSAKYVDLPLIFVSLGVLVSICLIWFTLRANRAYPESLLDSLRQQIIVPDPVEKDDTVTAMPPKDQNTLVGDVEAAIEQAQELRHAIDTLTRANDDADNPASGLRLLKMAIEENLATTIQASLHALAKMEDSRAVDVIRAGVISSEAQSKALAREALNNLKNKSLAKSINDLLEKGHNNGMHRPASANQFSGIADVIEWAGQHIDPWLRQCAEFVSSQDTGASVPEGDVLERILMLKTTPIFEEVSTKDLRSVARELTEVTFGAGQRIFDINDPSDRFFIIVKGNIGISTHPDPRKKNFIVTLGPGAFMGEMGCFEQGLRSGTAHVLEDSVLLALEKEKLHGLILKHPQLSIGLLRGLGARLRKATKSAIH